MLSEAKSIEEDTHSHHCWLDWLLTQRPIPLLWKEWATIQIWHVMCIHLLFFEYLLFFTWVYVITVCLMFLSIVSFGQFLFHRLFRRGLQKQTVLDLDFQSAVWMCLPNTEHKCITEVKVWYWGTIADNCTEHAEGRASYLLLWIIGTTLKSYAKVFYL